MGVISMIRRAITHALPGTWHTITTYHSGQRVEVPALAPAEQMAHDQHWVYVCTTKIATVVGAAK